MQLNCSWCSLTQPAMFSLNDWLSISTGSNLLFAFWCLSLRFDSFRVFFLYLFGRESCYWEEEEEKKRRWLQAGGEELITNFFFFFFLLDKYLRNAVWAANKERKKERMIEKKCSKLHRRNCVLVVSTDLFDSVGFVRCEFDWKHRSLGWHCDLQKHHCCSNQVKKLLVLNLFSLT